MKTKTTILSLLLLICASFSFAQETTIDWGKPFESKTEVKKIIGIYDGVMFAYSEKGKKNFIQGFDESGFKQKFSNEFTLERKNYLLDMIISDEGPIAFTYKYNKKEKSVEIFAKQFNAYGKEKGKKKLIMKAIDLKKVNEQNVLIKLSEDRSKILISYFRQERKNNNFFYGDFVVLNKSLDILSKNPFKEDLSKFSEGKDVSFTYSTEVDNTGAYIFSLSKFAERRKQTSKYSLSVYEFNNKGKKVESKNIIPKGKGIDSPKIFIDEKSNTFRVVGFYFNNEKKGKLFSRFGYNGIYSTIINRKTLKVVDSKITPFPNDFLKRIYKAKKVNKANEKGKELNISLAFKINNLFINDKGDLIVSAESFTYGVYQQSGATTRTWVFGDVIVMSINNKGEMNWINTIKKTQVASKTNPTLGGLGSLGGGFLTLGVSLEIGKKFPKEYSNYSYLAGLGSNNLFLLYNDHYKLANKDQDKRKALTNPKKSIPYQYTFDFNTGIGKKKPLINDADRGGTYLAPQVYYKLSDNKYIVWARYRKDNKFGLVTFK